jgi:hypothetical protein
MATAKISAPISGNKLYQDRARAALPILARQAKAGSTLFYSDLAQELGMPNPRNLNYVLGSIGQTLEHLSKQWKTKVPPIQALVVNKHTGLPGEGIGWFLVKEEEFATLPRNQKQAIVKAELNHVFTFPQWDKVLEALDLEPAEADFSHTIELACQMSGRGESEHHKTLKDFVARNPISIGLSLTTPHGLTEKRLPSGDSLDVSFTTKSAWIAAEVKSSVSSVPDITRGLFQCVKYQAVMEAVLLAQSQTKDVRALLVLESKFPASLLPLKNLLGVEVIDLVTPE